MPATGSQKVITLPTGSQRPARSDLHNGASITASGPHGPLPRPPSTSGAGCGGRRAEGSSSSMIEIRGARASPSSRPEALSNAIVASRTDSHAARTNAVKSHVPASPASSPRNRSRAPPRPSRRAPPARLPHPRQPRQSTRQEPPEHSRDLVARPAVDDRWLRSAVRGRREGLVVRARCHDPSRIARCDDHENGERATRNMRRGWSLITETVNRAVALLGASLPFVRVTQVRRCSTASPTHRWPLSRSRWPLHRCVARLTCAPTPIWRELTRLDAASGQVLRSFALAGSACRWQAYSHSVAHRIDRSGRLTRTGRAYHRPRLKRDQASGGLRRACCANREQPRSSGELRRGLYPARVTGSAEVGPAAASCDEPSEAGPTSTHLTHLMSLRSIWRMAIHMQITKKTTR